MSVANNVKCPVCGSTKDKIIWGTYSSEEAASFFCPSSKNPKRYQGFLKNIENIWGQKSASIIECKQCDFAFSNPYIGGDNNFYTLFAEQIGYSTDKWDYKYALDNYITKSQDKLKILDIGAGEGLFLDKLGNNFSKHAIEGSETTSNILRNKNINVFTTFEHALETHTKSFDIITMFQVFEHISDFDYFLHNIFNLLKVDGMLILSVPNLNSVKNQFLYLNIVDMIPNHVNKWSLNSIQRVLKKHNLQTDMFSYQKFNFEDFKTILHHKIKCEAINKKSIYASIYSLKNKKLRGFLLSFFSLPYIFKLIPIIMSGKLSNSNIILKIVKNYEI